MVLTLYGMGASPPVRAVQIIINKLNISDVEYVHVSILKGEQKEDNFLKVDAKNCPGVCMHALASLICSNVLEEVECPNPSMKCCVDEPLGNDTITTTRKPFTTRYTTTEAAEEEDATTRPDKYKDSGNIACPGVCVESRYSQYCEAYLTSVELCVSGRLCCVSRDVYGDKRPPDLVVPSEKKHSTKRPTTAMNPQHSIPTLKDDDFTIWDSHAITAYLVSKYAKDDSLNPAEPKQRAIIDQRLHFDSGVLFPALRQILVPLLFYGAKSYDQASLDNISVAYDLAEKFLTRPWMAGDSLTLADVCCYATISSMNVVLPITAEQFPKLAAWLQRCTEQDFMKNGNEEGLALFRELMQSKLA